MTSYVLYRIAMTIAIMVFVVLVTESTAGMATGTDATRRIRTISDNFNRTARA